MSHPNAHLPPASAPAGLYTASRIGAVLGRPRRSLRRILASIQPDGTTVVNGNAAAAWLFCSLPIALQGEIKEAARRRGYASEEHLLQAPPDHWEPNVPLSQVDAMTVQEASDLQRALTPTLERLHRDITAELADITAEGLASYRKIVGHGVTKRHFDRLIKRTIARDHGAENWTRLELFLPDRVAVKKATIIPIGFDDAWQPMLTMAASVTDKNAPTHQELCLFWDHALACYEAALERGQKEKRARRELRRVIEAKIPFVRLCGRALEAKIKRALAQWTAGGRTAAALADGRKKNPGRPRAATLPTEYKDKLIATAVLSAGGLSQAFRESQEKGWCPPQIVCAYPFDYTVKSYVPESIRAELQPEIKRLAPLAIGPRYADLHGPYVNRNYTKMPSGVQFQSDDCTLPVYFWIRDANGNPERDEKGRPVITRGQFLPWIDTRSTFILTFQLIPEKTYDTLEIRRGISRVHDEYGLPDEFSFERGIWGSKLIDGTKGDNVPWKDYAYGLSTIGVRVRHAKRAPAKIVERVLGALQDRMNNLRGYCGRNEAKDCPEETKKALQLVRAGHAHPSEYFYSSDEWVLVLEGICNAYNAAPQNGKMLDGMSPEQAFVQLRKSPPIKLPPDLRYLLACHRVEVTVSVRGVEVPIGGRTFTYKDEQTSAKVHERVLAWFNTDDPDTICVTDLNHKNPFTVRRETEVDAFDADPETLARAQRENFAQTKHRRTKWANLKKNFPEVFQRTRRMVMIDPTGAQPVLKTLMLGAEMDEQRKAAIVEGQAQDRLRDKGDRLARKLGLRNAGQRINAERVEALSELDRAGVKAVNPYSYEDKK